MLLRLMARTAGSGPVNEGSTPSEAANFNFKLRSRRLKAPPPDRVYDE